MYFQGEEAQEDYDDTDFQKLKLAPEDPKLTTKINCNRRDHQIFW